MTQKMGGVEMNLGNFGGGQNFFQKNGKNTRKYPILACFSAKFGGGSIFFWKKMGGVKNFLEKMGGGETDYRKNGGEETDFRKNGGFWHLP